MGFHIRAFDAADKNWLVAEHAAHYAQVEGFDETFGPLVERILDDFLANHDPCRAAGWIAHRQKARLGSIFCVPQAGKTAKLRLFYLVSAARGSGAAQALLQTCLNFARSAGYTDMTLWTHASHVAAGRIYRRNGFQLIAEKPVHSFGVDLVEQTWVITL